MVGGSRRILTSTESYHKKDAQKEVYKRRDIESRGNARHRFRDAVTSVIEDGRRERLKRELSRSVENDNYEPFRKGEEELKQIKNKKVRAFYEAQNDRISDWSEADTIVKYLSDDVLASLDPQDRDLDGIPEPGIFQSEGENIEPFLPDSERERRAKQRKYANYAININLVVNVLLLAAKVVAAFASSSLSLIASLADSALDLLCVVIIWTTNKLVAWKISSLRKRFPIGRRRLEPIGILVFSILMVISFLEILQQSFKKVLPGAPHEVATLPLVAILSMAATVLVKGIIYIGCVRSKSSQVQALAKDCKTDVIFNTLSLAFPFLGRAFSIWWLDPVGAGLLSIFIIIDWASTCLENVALLSGISADERLQRKVMYVAWRFAPFVKAFKSVTAYHAGEGIWVEVDLLLDPKMSLEQTHDISECLQICMEGLQEVDRAFVTADYSLYGPIGHTQNG